MGVQVMLIKNMDETLVNGTMGKIIGSYNAFSNLWDLILCVKAKYAE